MLKEIGREPKISEVDWNNYVPEYIEAPRIWRHGFYNKVREKYVGIAFDILPLPSESEGDVFWCAKSRKESFPSWVKFIYERSGEGRYKFVSKNANKICSECNGKGQYIGFVIIENCKTCDGRGYI